MNREKEKTLTRRDFLQLAATVVGVSAICSGGFFVFKKSKKGGIPRLNAAFRIKELSGDKIELFTNDGNGNILKHRFSGLEADFFREVAKEQDLDKILKNIAEKRKISMRECGKKLKKSLKEFEEASLIYYGDKMLVKIVELKNDRKI